MKRMMVIWILCILVVIGAGIVNPAWSALHNVWTINALILLVFLLLNEVGLHAYRRRMRDIGTWMQQKRPELRRRK
ncbi:MAG: hypothetical protein AAFR67_12400, partial [Chloroflexota bacterium]